MLSSPPMRLLRVEIRPSALISNYMRIVYKDVLEELYSEGITDDCEVVLTQKLIELGEEGGRKIQNFWASSRGELRGKIDFTGVNVITDKHLLTSRFVGCVFFSFLKGNVRDVDFLLVFHIAFFFLRRKTRQAKKDKADKHKHKEQHTMAKREGKRRVHNLLHEC